MKNSLPLRKEESYYDDGSIKSQVFHSGDHIHGTTKTWHQNGQIASEVPFVESKIHGVSRYWNSTGKLLGENLLVRGTGVFREWYDDGKLKCEMQVVSGFPYGWQRCWDEDGKLTVETFFQNGRPSKRKTVTASNPTDVAAERMRFKDQLEDTSKSILAMWVTCDAKDWLNEKGSRTFGENLSHDMSSDMLAKLKKAGALEVFVVAFKEDEFAEDSVGSLMIKLPQNIDQRRKIFVLQDELQQHEGFGSEKDVGQNYLFVSA